jgi:triacylglycerol lipase
MIAWVLRLASLIGALIAFAFAVWSWRSYGAALGVATFFAVVLAIYVLALGFGFFTSFRANRAAATEQTTARLSLIGQCKAFWQELWLSIKIFGVWQPFLHSGERKSLLPEARSHAQTAQRAGIVFIHGYFCNSVLWRQHEAWARARGIATISLTLEPAFGSIDDYAPLVDRAVSALTAHCGTAPILVGHSMGGLAARAFIAQHPANAARIAHVITLGTPHHGTVQAQHGIGLNGAQMRRGSAWLERNAERLSAAARVKFSCYFSNGDNIVSPCESGMLDGAHNIHLPGLAHMALGFDAAVFACIEDKLKVA